MTERKVHLFEIGASGFRVHMKGVAGYRTNFTVNVITTSLSDALTLFNAAYEFDEKIQDIEVHHIQKRDRMTDNFIVDPLLRIASKEEIDAE